MSQTYYIYLDMFQHFKLKILLTLYFVLPCVL